MVTLWVNHECSQPIQSVWDIISAVAALATAVIAGVALVAAVRAGRAAQASLDVAQEALAVERARDVALARRVERSEQADRVAAWMGLAGEAVIRNATDLPIRMVTVRVHDLDGRELDSRWFGIVEPGDKYERFSIARRLGLAHSESECPVSIEFTDAGGRHWLRDWHGSLAQVGADTT